MTRDYVPEHRHKWVACLDSSTQDLLVYMKDICNFIEQMSLPFKRPLPSPEKSSTETSVVPGVVLVHCEQGVSRSPTIVVAYLMRKRRQKFADVLAIVGAKRKIRISPNFTKQLEIWEEVEYEIWEDVECRVPKAPYKAFLEERAALLKAKGLTGDEPIAPVNL